MADERRGPETSLSKMIGGIADETGVSRAVVRKVIYAFLNAVGRNLAAGIRTKITNFGSFYAAERRFHNPHTGEMNEPVMWATWTPTGLLREMVKNRQTDGSLEKRPRGSLTPSE